MDFDGAVVRITGRCTAPSERPTIGRFRPFTCEESVVRPAPPPVLGTGAPPARSLPPAIRASDDRSDLRREALTDGRTDLQRRARNDGGGGGGGRHPISTRS